LSRSHVVTFRHNDLDHLQELLTLHRATHDHAMIATDGVFSMDGAVAPAAELANIAQRHEAWLMTDDAHGIGVLGGGHGTSRPDIPLQMGTLSKAIGAYGGYLTASQPVIDLVRNRARTFVYSTGLPPAMAAAAIAAPEPLAHDSHYAA